MSTHAGTVTAGYTWTADGSGNIQLTAARLNSAALPSISVTLTGALLNEDLSDSSVATRNLQSACVSLVKLASDVAAMIPKLSLTAVDDGDGSGQLTIQLQDANGNILAQRFLVRVWISTTSYGTIGAISTFAPTTGAAIVTNTANAHFLVLSDGNGTIVLNVNPAGAGTWYVMVELDGKVSSAAVTITA